MSQTLRISEDSWPRRFLAEYLERHPVDATFIGVHDHDHRLPPMDEAGVDETLSTLHRLRQESSREESPGPREERADEAFEALDRRLIRGFLETRIREYETGHVLGNPSVHVGNAVFGLMAPLLTLRHRPGQARDALAARIGSVPGFLRDVRDGFRRSRLGREAAAAPWIRRAMRECLGGRRFLRDGLKHVRGGDAPWSDADVSRAAAAFEEFGRFLEHETLPGSDDRVACGAETFSLYLEQGHFLERGAEEIATYARDEMARTRAWLEAAASDFGAAGPEDVVAALAERHPPADGYLARYGETWRDMRRVALDRELLTWPDVPIEYVPRPRWARAAAPCLYFLFYRSPPAFDAPKVHRYMVEPLDGDRTDEASEAFLRANNDSVIKLNHVVHHGGIGHHVQNGHAAHSPSLVGRVAAVDCASRIAMFCGGSMAEGWACYATDLMAEAGGLTALERYAEHHARLRMCARAVVDVELHHGRMSLDDAAGFYRNAAGMSGSGAESEAVKNSMFPGAALMYLVGTDLIHELRRDIMTTLGDDFTLGGFHDAFLSYGSVPVRLISEEMRRRAAEGVPLDAHAEVPPGYVPSWSGSGRRRRSVPRAPDASR